MFRLVKWYLDVVTDEGTAVIAYAADLLFRGVSLSYASVLVSPPAGRPTEHSFFGRVTLPRLNDGLLTWQHPPLRMSGCWHRTSPGIHRRILRNAEGDIQWDCEMPCAEATVQIGAQTFVGLGYAECLSLSMPPWKLPFHTLRWGRYVSAQQSVVWIDWAGQDARSYIWHDGVEQHDACLRDLCVSGLGGTATLTWHDGRDVCDRPALARLTRRLPPILQRLGGPLAAMKEHKQIARGTIERGGKIIDRGWTIWEQVTW